MKLWPKGRALDLGHRPQYYIWRRPMSTKLHVKFLIVEGDWDTTDPIEAIAPQGMRTGILQELQVDLRSGGTWHVWGGDDACTWHGYGDSQAEAVLDWLADRLVGL